MNRRIRDDYGWRDAAGEEDGAGDYAGAGFGRVPRPRKSPFGGLLVALVLAILVLGAGAIAAAGYTQVRQEDDRFCIGCHTAPHVAYQSRAEAALGGAYALDLSSYHYQQIRGTGGSIRCIDCHRGDQSTGARAATLKLSAEMTLIWLANQVDDRIEKTTITATRVITRDGATVTLAVPVIREPALTNDGCVNCHKTTLLTAGMDNHTHNMLPAVYTLWKNGNRLIAPPRAGDPQALLARGLTPYATAIQCASCHTGHRALETDVYLDRALVAQRCNECHLETRKK